MYSFACFGYLLLVREEYAMQRGKNKNLKNC
jgi:hypothetical protein